MIATALAGIALPQYASAACGHEAVSVSGTAEEVADACRALDEVVSYFRKIGFRPAPDIRISFRDHVYIDMYVPAGKEPVGREEVSGAYDCRRKELHIASVRRESRRDRKPWGIAWGLPIAYSILQHELVHATVAGLLGSDYQKLGKAWHEMIAYAVQFDLMDRDLKHAVLANYPNAQPFGFPESVNSMVHGADPDAFGISAHLYAEANGGLNFVRRILAKEVSFGTGEFECEYFWVK